MEKNIIQPDRPQMTIWSMRIACWIAKTIDTHLLYVLRMGPCHHGMARPQVADGGTASDMEGSC